MIPREPPFPIIEKPVDYSSPEINGYREIVVFNAGNGGNWYITAIIDNRVPRIGGGEIPFGNFYLIYTTIIVVTLGYFIKRRIHIHKNCKNNQKEN